MKKRCGGCQHWLKVTLTSGAKSGICNLIDAKCNSDHKCDKWKAIPFTRK